MRKRRFSITQEQGDLLQSALSEYISVLQECIDIADQIGNSHMYENWRQGEAQRLYRLLETYNWEV